MNTTEEIIRIPLALALIEFTNNIRIACSGERKGALLCSPQNWNGDLYQGASAAMLAAKCLAQEDIVPVFVTKGQAIDLHLKVKGEGTNVILASQKGGMYLNKVWSLSETNMPKDFPEVYEEIKKELGLDNQDQIESLGLARVASHIDKDAVRMAASAEKGSHPVLQEFASNVCHLLVCANLGVFPEGVSNEDMANNVNDIKIAMLKRQFGQKDLYDTLCRTGIVFFKRGCNGDNIFKKKGIDIKNHDFRIEKKVDTRAEMESKAIRPKIR